MLHEPIRAKYFPETDTWAFYGVATFGTVLHRGFGVSTTQPERDEYNVMSDFLNAEVAAGRDPYDGVAATAADRARYEATRRAHGLSISGGSGEVEGPAESDGMTATSAAQRPTCPRGNPMPPTRWRSEPCWLRRSEITWGDFPPDERG